MVKTIIGGVAVSTSLALLAGCANTAAVSKSKTEVAGSIENTERKSAKNVILMVSDGIGFNGWLAVDYYQGLAGLQSYQVVRPDGTKPALYGMTHTALNLIDEAGNILQSGTDPSLAAGAVEQSYDPLTRWQRLENGFRSDYQGEKLRYTSYTDSAAAGTALMSGRKTANGRINMDWSGEVKFQTIGEIAMQRDRSAGAVSSVMASHATPAAVAAHNISRNNYSAIFTEMVSSDLTVIMGGGHPLYDSSGNVSKAEDDTNFRFVGGSETLNRLASGEGLNGFTFIDGKDDFLTLAAGEDLPDRVVGIARTNSTLQASREGLADDDTPSGMVFNSDVPDLATMSIAALNVLNQDQDGFFVMIEGGAVDWMGHANNMPRFIEEHTDFNLAARAVIAWVEENSSWDETLLIVTADHETGAIWGEGTWTNSVGGPVANDTTREAIKAAQYDPMTDRFNGFFAVQDRGAGTFPGYQFATGNHSNELVPLWAIGVGSDRFTEFTRTDLKAAELWGEPYGWDGQFIDNINVFQVMEETLR